MGKESLLRWVAEKPLLTALLFAGMVVTAICLFRAAGYLQLSELTAHDLLLAATSRSESPEVPVVLVGVTEAEIQSLGQWPLTDAMLSEAIEQILAWQPRVLGVDIYRDQPVPPGAEKLEKLLATTPNLVMIHKLGTEMAPSILPPGVLQGTDRIGFSDMVVDPDGTVRRALLFLDDGQEVFASLSLQLALGYLQAEGIQPRAGDPDPSHIRLGETTIPPFEANDGAYVDADAAGYQFLLNYQDGRRPFRQFSLMEIADAGTAGAAIRDSVVILGVTADSVKDAFVTPFSHAGNGTQTMTGIALHGHIVSQLLRMALAGEQPLRSLADVYEILLIALWGVLGALAAVYIKQLWYFTLVIAGGVAVIIALPYLALLQSWWLPLVPAMFAWILSAGVVMVLMRGQERSRRKQLMELFSRNVSADIAAEIWNQREQFLEGGRLAAREVTATVLFSDLENFTPVSEQLGPTRLMEWLNHYMETMAGLVMQHHGIVDDYYGDAIMADFGVPLVSTSEAGISQDARNAVDCALAMRRVIEQLNQESRMQGLPPVRMRIGICTGHMVAGFLGNSQRMKYTTIGDTVNTAARLESYGKELPAMSAAEGACRILLGASTVAWLGDDYQLEAVGDLALKGKAAPVSVFKVLGKKNWTEI